MQGCKGAGTGLPEGDRLACSHPPPPTSEQPLAPPLHRPTPSGIQRLPAAAGTHILASLSVLQAT